MEQVKKTMPAYSIAEESNGTFILYCGKAKTRHASKADAMKVVEFLKLDSGKSKTPDEAEKSKQGGTAK